MMKEQKSLGNKGFSLVELIVVIAIMAVLIGVLAPQFVKYVGKSEDARDKQNLETIRQTANAILADIDVVTVADGDEFIVTSGSVTVADGTSDNGFITAFEAAFGTDAIDALPKTTKYTITVNKEEGGGFTASVKMEDVE